MAGATQVPHFPGRAPIEAYGKRGFAFAGMSHRGSLLCLPQGIWAWPIASADEIDEAALAPVFAAAAEVGLFIFGTGRDPWAVPEPLRARFRGLEITVEAMTTGAAVRTYNILLGEQRRVAAGLIAVD